MIVRRVRSKMQLLRYPFLAHPGFTSQSERIALYRFLKNKKSWLEANDLCCVEFGPFLGSSTVALAEGLKNTQIPIIALDAFCFNKSTSFARYVMRILENNGISLSELSQDGDMYLFKSLFDLLCSPYESIRAYKFDVIQNISLSLPLNGKKCGFAHIDLPKTMDLGKPIFNSLADTLAPRSTIVLQDFAYRWSSELIIFSMILLANGARCIQMVGPSLYLELEAPAKTLHSSISAYDGIVRAVDKESIETLLLNALVLAGQRADAVRYNEIALSCLIMYKNLDLSNNFKESLGFKLNPKTFTSLLMSLEDIFLHGGLLERSFN